MAQSGLRGLVPQTPALLRREPSAEERVTNDSSFLVDIILPKHEVHLLAGPSGAGKTRWLMHQLLEWEKGMDFLGFRSHPVPWVYIAADRSVLSVQRTLIGMGIQPGLITAIPAWDRQMSENEIMDKICASKAHLAIWESFGSFVEPPGQGAQVKKFLSRMNKFCDQSDKTIIGVMESPKQKPYERYENPRQRISGAAAWGHFTETIFLVEQEDFEKVETPYRTLHMCPRNAPAMKIFLAFDMDGRLLPVQEDDVHVFLKHRARKASTSD